MSNRSRAALIHLAISLIIAALAAGLVFLLWYPEPYGQLSGGRELFLILVIVDVIIGPAITLIIYSTKKSRLHLLADFSVIGALQLSALFYGLWTMHEARPVHLVFEYHRMAVVHAVDVHPELLQEAPAAYRRLPLTGPTLLSLRPLSANEMFDFTMLALDGIPLAAQPGLWQPYAHARADILKESRPLAELRSRFPEQAPQIDKAAARAGLPEKQLRYLPMLARTAAWTVLIDAESLLPVGYLPIDSF